jgi:ribosomal protein S18 acetylase RimI-like enzyme
VEIREVRPDEHPLAGEVTVAAWRDLYGEDLGNYADHLRDIDSRAKDAVVLVALEGDEIIGTVTYVPGLSSPFAVHLKDGEAMIRMLSVAPAHKRRGVGRALSLACVERARAEGSSAIVLHADEIMDASQRLYESIGFRRDPARDFHPDDQTFVICYVLDL